MAKSYREAFHAIQEGRISPVYLLYGKEKVLMEEMVDALREQIAPQDPFHFLRFHCDETPVQQVIQEAETAPFLAERRLLVADEAFFFTGMKASRGDHDLSRLEKYLAHPAAYSVVVFLVAADKLDERKNVTKRAREHGEVIAFPQLREEECREWIERRVHRWGKRITPAACARLLLTIGPRLDMLLQEVEKLCLYLGEQTTINEEIVDRLASRTVEEDVFVFLDAVVRGETALALRRYYDLLKKKESPLKLLFLLTRQVRLMMQVKLYSRRGIPVQHMASQIGVHPYVCKRVYEQASRYSETDIANLYHELAECDQRIKFGTQDDVQALEMLLLSLPYRLDGKQRMGRHAGGGS